MAWSADDDVRNFWRTARVGLRVPDAVYGLAAFVLHLSIGFMALLWIVSSQPGFEAANAPVLAIPAVAAAVVAAMTVGAALYNNEVGSIFTLVTRTGMIWAGVAVLWPLTTALPIVFAKVGRFASAQELARPFAEIYPAMLAMAWEGAIAGAVGAIAAAFLCVERR